LRILEKPEKSWNNVNGLSLNLAHFAIEVKNKKNPSERIFAAL